MEQVDDLLEGGVGGEVLDLVPDVGERALRPVDVGQVGVRRDDLSEPFVRHGLSRSLVALWSPSGPSPRRSGPRSVRTARIVGTPFR
jgi:hypothetical protein